MQNYNKMDPKILLQNSLQDPINQVNECRKAYFELGQGALLQA